jgi:hypothetical protein
MDLPVYKKVYYALSRATHKAEYVCKGVYREPKYAIQRMKNGVSDRDVWNFNYHLAGVLATGLERIAKQIHGVPQAYLDGEDLNNDNIDAAMERWQSHLRSNADVFKRYVAAVDSWSSDEPIEEPKEWELEMALIWVAHNFGSLWT